MGGTPTVYDVAAQAGVSIATVSRVLRRPSDVRPDTRDRVLVAVRSLGYIPSAAARGLAGRRTGVIGLLLPGHDDIDAGLDLLPDAGGTPVLDDRLVAGARNDGPVNLYLDEVVRGAEGEAWRRGFALLIAAGRNVHGEELVDDLVGRVDGLVIVAAAAPDSLLDRVPRHVPVVMVADSRDGHGLDRVVSANEEGMHMLVSTVLRPRAVDRVAYLGGPADSPDEHDRWAGFQSAIRSLEKRPEVTMRVGDFSVEGGRRFAAEIADAAELRPDLLPGAIVCANDQMAIGVLGVLRERGIRVPERLVVTGFDGVDAGRYSVPRLTTVRQPMAALGRVAVQTMVERLTDRDAPSRSVTLPVQILLRESCPPVR